MDSCKAKVLGAFGKTGSPSHNCVSERWTSNSQFVRTFLRLPAIINY